jgi:hypothetical protein
MAPAQNRPVEKFPRKGDHMTKEGIGLKKHPAVQASRFSSVAQHEFDPSQFQRVVLLQIG